MVVSDTHVPLQKLRVQWRPGEGQLPNKECPLFFPSKTLVGVVRCFDHGGCRKLCFSHLATSSSPTTIAFVGPTSMLKRFGVSSTCQASILRSRRGCNIHSVLWVKVPLAMKYMGVLLLSWYPLCGGFNLQNGLPKPSDC